MFCIRDKFTLIDFQRKQIVEQEYSGYITNLHCKNIKLPLTTHIILNTTFVVQLRPLKKKKQFRNIGQKKIN